MKNSGIPWIGEIPEKWNLVQGKRLFISRKRIVGDDVEKYERLALTMNGVIKRNKDDNEGLQPEQFEGYQILRKNELVFKLIDLQNVKTSRVGLSPYEGIVSPAYITLQNASKDNRFYYYWYMFLYHYQVYNKLAGDGVRSALNVDDLLQIPIPEIPLSEQQAIADFLDKKCAEIDQMVALQEKFIEELKAYKQSLITETVTKGLNPNAPMKDSGVEWIGEIPEGWEITRFKNIASVKANLVSPEKYQDMPQVAPDNIEKDAGILLNYKKVREANIISDNHLFFKGQIIYSKIRPMLNKVIIAPFDGLCSADMYPIETTQHTNYLLYFMLSGIFTKQVQRIVNDRVKMPKINKEEISTILTIIPSLAEQEAIADFLDKKCSEIDQLIAIKQKKIEEYKEYKKSIIYEYVTGKRSVCE